MSLFYRVLFFVVLFSSSVVANILQQKDLPDDVVADKVSPYKAHQILVKLKGKVDLVKIPYNVTPDDAVKIYELDPEVEYAEKDYYYRTLTTVNDPDYSKQYALRIINAASAWEVSQGSKDVVVGIIDTGVFYTHPDLSDNIWNNPGEIPGNGIDDDNNGYVDDIHGINAIAKNGDPLDDHGHGSHVAGIIGASGDNGVGISGVNQHVSMIGCKFLDARGGGSASDALTCINYFAMLKEKGVNVIATNNSWGGGGYSKALHDAIGAHRDRGILFVAAAGNDTSDNDSTQTYPANYDLANIISVAASDDKDELAYFSNYGRQSVHVAAPGNKIWSTYLKNGYKEMSGTSMAAPQVTGLVALLKAARPELDFRAIRSLIIASGDKVAAAKDKTISDRRIKAFGSNGLGALSCANQSVTRRITPVNNASTMTVGNSLLIAVMNINCEAPAGAPLVMSGGRAFQLNDDGQNGDQLAGDGVYSALFAPTEGGQYQFDFEDGQSLHINVLNPSAWRDYQATVQANFEYRKIEGTRLNLGDDSVQAIESPFPIHFAGDEGGFKTLQVGSNGTLSFTDTDLRSWQNARLPVEKVQTLIAPYWDDLVPDSKGNVYWQVLGQAPHRELVVEWRNVSQLSAGKGGTFEVVFFEDNSSVLFNYLDLDFKSDSNFGKSATVGIQTGTAKAALFSYNEANLKNNMAVLFENPK